MMDRRFVIAFGVVFVAVAIAAGVLLLRPAPDPEGFQSPTDTPAPLSAAVSITHPPDGAILYAEALFVQGIAEAPQTFRVEMVDIDGRVVVSGVVETAGGAWSLEMPHDYDGDPGEATMRVLPLTGDGEYARRVVLLSPLSQRPEGTFGTVTFPTVGGQVGGDAIPVEGRASGVPQNALTVELIADDGRVLDTQTVTLLNPYYVDDIPWALTVAPGDYVGSATIEVTFSAQDDAEVIPVVVSSAAG